MQKKVSFIIVGVTVTITLIILLILAGISSEEKSADPFIPPAPTAYQMNHDESDEKNKNREAFFAQMHRADPTTNYLKMDHNLRVEKMMQRMDHRINGRADTWDTLAAGFAIGQWKETGSFNTSGRIWATEIDFNTETVYAFSDGGNLWKGDLNGDNWSITNDNFKITASKLLRKINDRIIVATDQWFTQCVFYSEDEGVSWNESTGMENVENWGYVFDAVIANDSLQTMYVLAYNWDYITWNAIVTLFKSTDLGTSFVEVKQWDEPTYGGSGKFNIWSSRDGIGNVFLIENNHFYSFIEDDSLNFLSTIPSTFSGDVSLCGYENGSDQRFYIAVYNYDESKSFFYKSVDAGITFEETGSVDSYFFSNTSFNCAKKNPDQLFIGGIDTYESGDGGFSWNLINHWYEYYDDIKNYLHADIPYIESYIDPSTDEEIVLISTDGGLYKTYNYGNSVENITMEGMRSAQYYDVYTNRSDAFTIYAGAQDQGYQRSAYWIGDQFYFDQLISGDYGHFASTDGGENLWMVYPGFITYIKEAASSSIMTFGDFEGDGYLWIPPVMNDPIDKEICWWAGGKYLYKVEKIGLSLDYDKQDFNFSDGDPYAAISAIAYSPIDSNYWYLLNSVGDFFYSSDYGMSWTKSASFDGPDSHWFYGSVITPSNKELGTVYIGGSGYSNPPVYKSMNHGVSFTTMSIDLPSTLIYDMVALSNDSLIFAATEIGPYVYVKETNKWYDIASDDAPYQIYWSVDYVEEIHTARFGTYGRGIFDFALYTEPEEPPLAIEIQTKELFQVFPVPADASISLISNQFVPLANIVIYDIKGNRVVEKKQVSLNKNIPFQISTNHLINGNYFIAIEVSQKITSKKILIQH